MRGLRGQRKWCQMVKVKGQRLRWEVDVWSLVPALRGGQLEPNFCYFKVIVSRGLWSPASKWSLVQYSDGYSISLRIFMLKPVRFDKWMKIQACKWTDNAVSNSLIEAVLWFEAFGPEAGGWEHFQQTHWCHHSSKCQRSLCFYILVTLNVICIYRGDMALFYTLMSLSLK